jgi:hypothetical protein
VGDQKNGSVLAAEFFSQTLLAGQIIHHWIW